MASLSFFAAAPALCLTNVAEEFGLDPVRMGAFLSASFWGVVAAILVAGPLADRVGFRGVLVCSSLLQFVGFLVVSFAPGLRTALAGSTVIGLGVGSADALLTPIVCAVSPERRSRISNFLHAFYPIGLVCTIVLLVLLIHFGLSWRAIYRLLGLLAVSYGVGALFIHLPPRAHHGEVRLASRTLVSRPTFLAFVLCIFLAGVTELGPSLWLPHFVETAFGLTQALSGLSLLVFAVTMSAGRLAVSGLLHRIPPRSFFLISGILCIVSLVMAALPVGPLFSIAWLSVLGFSVAGLWPTILASAGDRFPAAGSSMFSLLSAAGNFGGVVGPFALGAAKHRWGLASGMALLATAPMLIAMIAGSIMHSPRSPRRGDRT